MAGKIVIYVSEVIDFPFFVGALRVANLNFKGTDWILFAEHSAPPICRSPSPHPPSPQCPVYLMCIVGIFGIFGIYIWLVSIETNYRAAVDAYMCVWLLRHSPARTIQHLCFAAPCKIYTYVRTLLLVVQVLKTIERRSGTISVYVR